MKVSGKEDLEMARASRDGLMALNTKAFGRTIAPMEGESSPISTETSMKETGSMIKLTALEYTPMLMELATKEPGKTIFNTAMERKAGLTAVSMRENT